MSSHASGQHIDASEASTAPPELPTDTENDHFMDLAFQAARDALANQEVPVGCIFVYDNAILSTGRNTVNETKNATRHAEINCIDDIYEHCEKHNLPPESVFGSTDVYVTVEPCIMCAAALINVGVRSVTYGCANSRFGGCGSVLNVPRDLMTSNVVFRRDEARSEEAVDLLKEFYKGENPNVPKTDGGASSSGVV